MGNLSAPVGAGLAACGATLALTGLVRRWIVRQAILDHPNERSSHATPKPRGGGLAVVFVVLAWLFIAGFFGQLERNTVIGITVGSAAVAAVGWLDDVRSVSALTRLGLHFLAALWTVAWLGGMPLLSLGGSFAVLGVFGGLLAVIGVVWATNLFNFMDGIDGIESVEAISIGATGGLLLCGSSPGLATLSFVMAGAALGFLFWNWAPAKIFLGDVGSGFIGFVFAALAVASENEHAVPVLTWAILAAAFIVDASLTFGRRLRAGYWRHAHRSHAYQRAVQAGWSHAAVSGAVGVLNVFLGGLAVLAYEGSVPLLVALALAFGSVAAVYAAVERVYPLVVTRSSSALEPK